MVPGVCQMQVPFFMPQQQIVNKCKSIKYFSGQVRGERFWSRLCKNKIIRTLVRGCGN